MHLNIWRSFAPVAVVLCTVSGCAYTGWHKVGDNIVNYSLGAPEKIEGDPHVGHDTTRSSWPLCEVFEHGGETVYELGVYFEQATRLLPERSFAAHEPFGIRVAPFSVEVFLMGKRNTHVPPLIRRGRMPCKEARTAFGTRIPII